MSSDYIYERDWANREKADLVKHIRNDGDFDFFTTEILEDAMQNDLVSKEELWDIFTDLKDDYTSSLDGIDDSIFDNDDDSDNDYDD